MYKMPFGASQTCHCKRGVFVTSVTVSEVCIILSILKQSIVKSLNERLFSVCLARPSSPNLQSIQRIHRCKFDFKTWMEYDIYDTLSLHRPEPTRSSDTTTHTSTLVTLLLSLTDRQTDSLTTLKGSRLRDLLPSFFDF